MNSPPDLFTIVTAPWMTYTVQAAIELGLVDALGNAEASLEVLAARVRLDAATTSRLVGALVQLGLVEWRAGGLALSAAGAPLADPNGELRSWSQLFAREFGAAWAGLGKALQSGRCAFEQVHGASIFQHLGSHPETARAFDCAMAGLSRRLHAALPGAYDFSAHRTLVDVGGGTGSLLAGVLASHPGLDGVLFEQPGVLERAEGVLREAGVRERCRLIGGDFFQTVPADGDVYMLSNIIHDWDDTQAARILQNCRNAIRPGGKLLLLEMALGENEPELARMTDMNMLVLTGGRERTRMDFERLVGKAGFELRSVAPLASSTCLIEAAAA